MENVLRVKVFFSCCEARRSSGEPLGIVFLSLFGCIFPSESEEHRNRTPSDSQLGPHLVSSACSQGFTGALAETYSTHLGGGLEIKRSRGEE